jgi:hypothetical protein
MGNLAPLPRWERLGEGGKACSQKSSGLLASLTVRLLIVWVCIPNAMLTRNHPVQYGFLMSIVFYRCPIFMVHSRKPLNHLISGPLAGAHSRYARPLIGLRDVPMELSRLRSRSAYQAPSSRPPSGFAPLGQLSRKIAKTAISVPNRRRLISQPVRPYRKKGEHL